MKAPSTQHSARREFGAPSGKLTGVWRMNKKFVTPGKKPKGPRHSKPKK